MFLEILSFIVGCLINVVDYMNDSNLFLKYKFISELLFFCLILFLFLYNKYVSFFGSGIFVFGGGIAGMLFAPHAVEAMIWKSVIYLAIPVFIYHIFNLSSLTADLSKEEINQFLFKVMPIVIGALMLALLEDYLVPEEFGNKKLYDKIFQTVVLILFIYLLNYSSYFENFSNINKLLLNLFSISWLGSGIPGIFILYNQHLFEKEEITVL